jgi:hypothetical protein
MTKNGIKSFSQSPQDGRCLEVWFDKAVGDVDRSWLLEAINEKTLRDNAADRASRKCEVLLAGENWQVLHAGKVISEHALHREATCAARKFAEGNVK